MKRLLIPSILLALAVFLPAARAADTVTSGTLTRTDFTAPGMKVVTLAWTSDSAGRVTANLKGIEGTIVRVVINPGATAPSANYDMVITDEDAVDVITGYGANLSATVTTSFTPFITNIGAALAYIPYPTQGNLDLAITNAGDSKVGTIKIFLRPGY